MSLRMTTDFTFRPVKLGRHKRRRNKRKGFFASNKSTFPKWLAIWLRNEGRDAQPTASAMDKSCLVLIVLYAPKSTHFLHMIAVLFNKRFYKPMMKHHVQYNLFQLYHMLI